MDNALLNIAIVLFIYRVYLMYALLRKINKSKAIENKEVEKVIDYLDNTIYKFIIPFIDNNGISDTKIKKQVLLINLLLVILYLLIILLIVLSIVQ